MIKDRTDIAININDKECPFTELIMQLIKTIETRKTHSLRPYLNCRVGICRTGKGKATLIGYATISEEIFYKTKTEFRNDFKRNRVSKNSKYFGGKYGYLLTDIEKLETPIELNTRGIISRKILAN